MKSFFDEVFSLADSTDFSTGLSGRFTHGEPQDKTQTPYAFYNGLPSENKDTFNEKIDQLRFQITICSDIGSSNEVMTLMDKCKAVYDDAVITKVGYRDASIIRYKEIPPMKDKDTGKMVGKIKFLTFLQKEI